MFGDLTTIRVDAAWVSAQATLTFTGMDQRLYLALGLVSVGDATKENGASQVITSIKGLASERQYVFGAKATTVPVSGVPVKAVASKGDEHFPPWHGEWRELEQVLKGLAGRQPDSEKAFRILKQKLKDFTGHCQPDAAFIPLEKDGLEFTVYDVSTAGDHQSIGYELVVLDVGHAADGWGEALPKFGTPVWVVHDVINNSDDPNDPDHLSGERVHKLKVASSRYGNGGVLHRSVAAEFYDQVNRLPVADVLYTLKLSDKAVRQGDSTFVPEFARASAFAGLLHQLPVFSALYTESDDLGYAWEFEKDGTNYDIQLFSQCFAARGNAFAL